MNRHTHAMLFACVSTKFDQLEIRFSFFDWHIKIFVESKIGFLKRTNVSYMRMVKEAEREIDLFEYSQLKSDKCKVNHVFFYDYVSLFIGMWSQLEFLQNFVQYDADAQTRSTRCSSILVIFDPNLLQNRIFQAFADL